MFIDEYDNIITDEELRESFHELKRDGETDCNTYEEYVRNCTSKNGTLTRVEE